MGDCYIVRRAGEAKKLPVLNHNYPADLTVWAGETATFQVQIATDGVPAEYTYKWYKNGNIITNATAAVLNLTGLTTATIATIYCVVTNKAGEVTSRVATLTVKNPNMTYTYTGSHEKIDDGSGNWRIKFKSSGTLKFTNLGKWDGKLDVFCVGGGSAGGSGNWDANNGYGKAGSGGYTKTQKSIQVTANTSYNIVIGAGGQSAFASGGSTSALGVTANGGTKLGNGDPQDAANIGIDHWGSPGKGQGTTTREFGESTGTLYAGGGGAGGNGSAQAKGGSGGGGNGAWNGNQPTSGAANTGGGGGGMYYNLTNVGKGGSGIAVIRNHR